MRERLIQLIEDMGVCLLEVYENEDVDLREYITSSVQYITFILSIEKAFCIHLPEDVLLYDTLKSFNAFVEIIENCCRDQQQER